MRALRSRECGLYEASDLLLGDHLLEKSESVVYVPVEMPHKRSRRLKNHGELVNLAEKSPDSEDIFMEDIVSCNYPNRPDDLEDLCLHDFVANYDSHSKDNQGRRIYRKVTKPRLVSQKMFDPKKEDQRESYFYSLLLLFVPFRDESSLLLEQETAEEAFKRLLPANVECSAYHARLQAMLKAQENLKAITDTRKLSAPEEHGDNEPQLMGEAKAAMQDVQDMNDSSDDDITLDERVQMLNMDQKRIYEKVKMHLLHLLSHESGECSCDFKPLRMFVSGVGGTGKSFLIHALKSLIHQIWPSSDLSCAIAAPTGLAAFNVGGMTIHGLFHLPIEHEGRQAGYWSLSKASQKVMKSTLRSLKLVIVDEVSMVSSLNLAYMHLRLEELFGGHDWFGSKSIVCFGDLLQLPPVNGSPVFQTVSRKSLCHKLGCATSVNIWQESMEYDELTINERQKKDSDFSDMLDSVRRGAPTEKTLETLRGRVTDIPIPQLYSDLQLSGKTPVCLFPTREQCDRVNEQVLQGLNTEIQQITCSDEIDETQSTRTWGKKAAEQLEKLNKDCNNTAGLQALLKVAVGARVMLRRNIDTKAGLVNGAIGTVVAISATQITIKFDHATDPYKIERVKSAFMVMKHYYVYRTQFLLILAYAVTIHKCQGLSLDCAIIDLSSKVFSDGMSYVALSRVKTLSGLHLVAFEDTSIRVSAGCIKEINRLRSCYRSDLPHIEVPVTRKPAKRKVTGTSAVDGPPSKKICISLPKKSTSPSPETPIIVSEVQSPFIFHCVDEKWQHESCGLLKINFACCNKMNKGTPCMPLTQPKQTHPIGGDGNCMFRSVSYVMTGSQEHHLEVRAKTLEHMETIAPLVLGHIRGRSSVMSKFSSVKEYVQHTKMDKQGTWGTEIELLVLSHLLKTSIYTYLTTNKKWFVFSPSKLDKKLAFDSTSKSVYLRHPPIHYDVVLNVQSTTQPIAVMQTSVTDSCNSSTVIDVSGPSDKECTQTQDQLDMTCTEWPELVFHPVDEDWQRVVCAVVSVPFIRSNRTHSGGATVVLRRPHHTQTIRGDGNCLFRSFSYLITGTQKYHYDVRSAIVAHMSVIESYIRSHGLKVLSNTYK